MIRRFSTMAALVPTQVMTHMRPNQSRFGSPSHFVLVVLASWTMNTVLMDFSLCQAQQGLCWLLCLLGLCVLFS